jgi:hypothetical protein
MSALSAAAGLPIQLSSLQSALSATNALTQGTADQAGALAAIGVTLNALNDQIDLQSNRINGQTDPGNNAYPYPDGLASMISYAGSLAAAIDTRSYIGRIGVNLTGAGG